MLNPSIQDICQIDESENAKLMVVVDTEEEFHWNGTFSRFNTAVKAVREVLKIQEIFDEYGIKPVYVVDYPVASQPDGYRPLLEIYQSGRCLIGAHVHPWVNPPFEEGLTTFSSFSGNLPYELELGKLKLLGQRIAESFGSFPTIYKAGRYGIGPNTASILEELDYEIDFSVCPYMDYSDEGGPNFMHTAPFPYWVGKNRRILELPLTSGYTGLLRSYGIELHGIALMPFFLKLHLPGMLARSGLVNKICLSPEGYTAAELIALTKVLYRNGLRVFTFAFHSPSLQPGNTPYVISSKELEEFLKCCHRFFEFFISKLDGQPSNPFELKTALLANEGLS